MATPPPLSRCRYHLTGMLPHTTTSGGPSRQFRESLKQLAAIERGDVLVQHPADQVIQWMLRGVGLSGQPGFDDRDHIAGVNHFHGALDAVFLDLTVIVDLRGFWGVTA